jgi:hypothetical protein
MCGAPGLYGTSDFAKAQHRSITILINNGLGEGFWSLLRQIVPMRLYNPVHICPKISWHRNLDRM